MNRSWKRLGLLAAALFAAFWATACTKLPPVVYPNHQVPAMVERTFRLAVDCPDDSDQDDTGGSAVRAGHHVVLTARHITDGREECAYTGIDSTGAEHPLLFVRQSDDFDAAVLAEAADLDSADLVDPQVGEHVWVVGYPQNPVTLEQVLKVTDGVVSAANDDDGQVGVTAAVYFGNSGGGVWNDQGQLVGLAVAFIRGLDGWGYMVPMPDIRKLLDSDLEQAAP